MMMAQRNYAAGSATLQTSRRAEYDVIAGVTHRLREKAQSQKNDYPAFVQALYDNRKLWNALVVDIADPKNELPDELRARILYLAEFTNKYSGDLLRKKKKSVLPLLEINMAILRGLKTEGPSK